MASGTAHQDELTTPTWQKLPLVQRDAARSGAVRLLKAKYLKGRGDASLKEGNFRDARNWYTQALHEVPAGSAGDAHLQRVLLSNRSRAQHSAGRFQEALTDADRVVNLAPGWSKGHYRRGRALQGMLRLVEAMAAFRHAWTLHDGGELECERMMEQCVQRMTRQQVADQLLLLAGLVTPDALAGTQSLLLHLLPAPPLLLRAPQSPQNRPTRGPTASGPGVGVETQASDTPVQAVLLPPASPLSLLYSGASSSTVDGICSGQAVTGNPASAAATLCTSAGHSTGSASPPRALSQLEEVALAPVGEAGTQPFTQLEADASYMHEPDLAVQELQEALFQMLASEGQAGTGGSLRGRFLSWSKLGTPPVHQCCALRAATLLKAKRFCDAAREAQRAVGMLSALLQGCQDSRRCEMLMDELAATYSSLGMAHLADEQHLFCRSVPAAVVAFARAAELCPSSEALDQQLRTASAMLDAPALGRALHEAAQPDESAATPATAAVLQPSPRIQTLHLPETVASGQPDLAVSARRSGRQGTLLSLLSHVHLSTQGPPATTELPEGALGKAATISPSGAVTVDVAAAAASTVGPWRLEVVAELSGIAATTFDADARACLRLDLAQVAQLDVAHVLLDRVRGPRFVGDPLAVSLQIHFGHCLARARMLQKTLLHWQSSRDGTAVPPHLANCSDSTVECSSSSRSSSGGGGGTSSEGAGTGGSASGDGDRNKEYAPADPADTAATQTNSPTPAVSQVAASTDVTLRITKATTSDAVSPRQAEWYAAPAKVAMAMHPVLEQLPQEGKGQPCVRRPGEAAAATSTQHLLPGEDAAAAMNTAVTAATAMSVALATDCLPWPKRAAVALLCHVHFTSVQLFGSAPAAPASSLALASSHGCSCSSTVTIDPKRVGAVCALAYSSANLKTSSDSGSASAKATQTVPKQQGRQQVMEPKASDATSALTLPYRHYHLVNVSGAALERPEKHPFRLSRVYYQARDLPNSQHAVWCEMLDGSCRWRQTSAEVKVLALQVPLGLPSKLLQVTIGMHRIEVRHKVTGAVYLQGRLERGVSPEDSTWTQGAGTGEEGCLIILGKMNLELYASHHPDLEGADWDDYEKDYSDLPAEVLAEHLAGEAEGEEARQADDIERTAQLATQVKEEARRRVRQERLSAFML